MAQLRILLYAFYSLSIYQTLTGQQWTKQRRVDKSLGHLRHLASLADEEEDIGITDSYVAQLSPTKNESSQYLAGEASTSSISYILYTFLVVFIIVVITAIIIGYVYTRKHRSKSKIEEGHKKQQSKSYQKFSQRPSDVVSSVVTINSGLVIAPSGAGVKPTEDHSPNPQPIIQPSVDLADLIDKEKRKPIIEKDCPQLDNGHHDSPGVEKVKRTRWKVHVKKSSGHDHHKRRSGNKVKHRRSRNRNLRNREIIRRLSKSD